MSKYIKKCTYSAVFWFLAVILAILVLPNTQQLIAQKGSIQIPAKAQSEVAGAIQDHWGHNISNTNQTVLVYGAGNHKINSNDQKKIDNATDNLKKNANYYGIKGMTTANENAATKKQLISKDGTTELVELNVSKEQSTSTIKNKLAKGAKVDGLASYVTGADVMNDDFSQSLADGIKKTELIATIFILIVLIIVFRSPIVPIFSLLTVGVSFIVSLSIVMNLGKYCGFPLSDFTQMFMVVVLFGIGTDYNILLYDKFKDNLSAGMEKIDATIDAQKVAGKTILYSGCSLLIGFLALGLAKFSVYRSGVAVAVGVIVLLFVLLTLNPFFMALLGKKMFWPVNKNLAETKRSSKLWGFLSRKSVQHPLIAIGVVLLCTLPFVFGRGRVLNYDVAVDLGNNLPAKKGLNMVQQKFSKGTAEPSTIYIKSDHPLDNEESMMEIDQITRQLQKNPKIQTVASVTQPAGTTIPQLYLNNQLGSLTGKLAQAGNGLTQLQNGLNAPTSSFDPSNLESIGSNAQSIGGHLKTVQGMTSKGMPEIQTPDGEQVITGMQKKAIMSGQPLTPGQIQIVGGGLQSVDNSAQKQAAAAKRSAARTQRGVAGQLTGVAQNTENIGNGAKGVAGQLAAMQREAQAKQAQANAGLTQINQGMNEGNKYLTELQNSPVSANTFYAPSQLLYSNMFKPAINEYISSDKYTTNIVFTLKDNPLDSKSMNLVNNIQNQVQQNIKGTSLSGSKVAIGGETAVMSDTKSIAQQDFLRTAVIMLVGILLALMIVTRSILQPFFIEGTLLLSYFTSLSLTQLFSKIFLGKTMLTWNTPFFTFIMLIALGVDYSIFLMMKYRETDEGTPSERIVSSASHIGVVVLSAAIILGGTFAALIPSGILTLIQVATGVIIGLLILILILPIIMPAAITLTYSPNKHEKN